MCHEIEQLQNSILKAEGNALDELRAYIAQINNECNKLHQNVIQNLKDLELNQDNLLKDILSETELVTRHFYDLNGIRVSPILRSNNSDRLSLKFLKWMHETDPITKNIPVAVCDGDFSIYPIQPTLYITPCVSQQGIRYFPIFFHEFGHLLYRLHQQEMDVLVYELQGAIKQILHPPTMRNDAYTEAQQKQQDVIVNTWYEWTQECFCDAVGFVMGGPAFAYLFSMYFRVLGGNEYHKSEINLAYSSHPVTWIRIHLLADRADRMGYKEVAMDLEEKWGQVAATLGVTEDYGGFYDQSFLPMIQEKIDDMLIETSAREFQESEVSDEETELTFSSPVALLNRAWRKFLDDPDGYRKWEENAITAFLDTKF